MRLRGKLDNFDQATVEASRKRDVPVSGSDRKAGLEIQEADRLDQANDQRESFFKLAVGLAIVTVATSVALVIGMTFFDYGVDPKTGIDPSVVIAFISGLTVETLGVLGIIAAYLYPSGRGAS